jgi:hypothetical protein
MGSIIGFPPYMIDNITESTKKVLSIDNDYIPICSLRQGNTIGVGLNRVLLYDLPLVLSIYLEVVNSRGYKNVLLGTNGFSSYQYLNNRRGLDYFFQNGVVMYKSNNDQIVKPLLLLCLKQEFLFTVNKTNPDLSNFIVIVSKQFKKKEHRYIYRNVYRDYILELNKYTDVMYVDSIEDTCLKVSSIVPPKFNTVVDMINHKNSINNLLYDLLYPPKTEKEIARERLSFIETREIESRRVWQRYGEQPEPIAMVSLEGQDIVFV